MPPRTTHPSPPTPPTVGVLALQGAFREHRLAFQRLGLNVREVRLPRAPRRPRSALAIPGGESTTMAKLMRTYGLDDAIRAFHAGGRRLARHVRRRDRARRARSSGYPDQPRLGLLDVAVARNDYGRQVASFEADLAGASGSCGPFHGVFIRAPRLVRVGDGWRSSRCTMAIRSPWPTGTVVATVFHPELSGDDRFHAQVLARWGVLAPNGAPT